MIEAVSPRSDEQHVEIAVRLMEVLNFSQIHQLMLNSLELIPELEWEHYYKLLSSPRQYRVDNLNPLVLVLEYYMFVKRLQLAIPTHYCPPLEFQMFIQSPTFCDIQQRFGAYVGQIEILRDDKYVLALLLWFPCVRCVVL